VTPDGGAPSACAHCGLPLARAAGGGSDEAYCCSGCYLAHRLSHRGLEGRVDRLSGRVVLAAFLSMGVMVFSLATYGGLLHEDGGSDSARALTGLYRLGALAFSTPVMLLLGAPLADAVVRLRRWLSAESLVLAGTLAAWSASIWSTFTDGDEVFYDTATMVLLLYSVGRLLDAGARERASRELRRILPEREAPALRVGAQGDEEVPADALAPGDLVRVRPGEIVPVDGRVESGRSFADTAALTGESQPRSIGPGDRVAAGITLTDGSLLVRAEAGVGSRMRDEIERLLREAMGHRARWTRTADRVAAWLLPAVLTLAAATVALRWAAHGAEDALLAGLSVVLISCPCALGIATPLATWTAIGAAWRRGVLLRGGDVLEKLARVRTVFFDKTGTLTSGELTLTGIETPGGSEAERARALALAASLEQASEHPLARAVLRAWRAEHAAPPAEPDDFRALAGRGVRGRVEGRSVELLQDESAGPETAVRLLVDGTPFARLSFRSGPRPEAREVLRALERRGLAVRVLTGDAAGPAAALGRELAVDVEARLGPGDKVQLVRAAAPGTAFVGDGLNDAAALASADVGVSVAGGARASLAAAEVNLFPTGLAVLPDLVDLARAAARTVRFNLAWAFAYNAVGLALAATGRLTPIFAAFAMVASSLAVVLNSARLDRFAPRRAAGAGDPSDGRSAWPDLDGAAGGVPLTSGAEA